MSDGSEGQFFPTREFGSRRQSASDRHDEEDVRVKVHQTYFDKVIRNVLESEVVPQLAGQKLLDRGGSSVQAKPVSAGQQIKDNLNFEEIILNGHYADSVDFVQTKLAGGISFRSICLGLFTTVARILGERWAADEISFVDVTRGLGKLHALVHEFADHNKKPDEISSGNRIIFANGPLEQHAFGLLLISEVFRMEGWQVTGGPSLVVGDELNRIIHDSWFDVIGLSASTEAGAFDLEEAIKTIRKASSNPAVAVLVGGHGFSEHPEISNSIGADGVADDADEALRKAWQMADKR